MRSLDGLFNCHVCESRAETLCAFSMAFQPIVNVEIGKVFAYEALVRGPNGEGADSVLAQVTSENKYAFDRHCRTKSIFLAAQLGLVQTGASLSINLMPGAVLNPITCLRTTLEAAKCFGIPLDRIIFELTENEEVRNPNHIHAIATVYRDQGLRIAIDDFGAGHSGLRLLADLPVDIIKLDMALTRQLANRPAALTIVKQIVDLARKLGSTIIAEGVETLEECDVLRKCGIALMQGYLFAKPAFEQLPDVSIPS